MSFMDEFISGSAPGITAPRLNEPFHLETMNYNAVADQVELTLGRGRATIGSSIIEKAGNSSYHITTPAINTTYYIYLGSDGNFSSDTTGGILDGKVLLWTVTTGAAKSTLTKVDKRPQILSISPGIVRYYQNTEPTDKTQKTLWYNPDTGMLYVADGSDYKPIPPAQYLQEIITFAESGISLAHTETQVTNGSVVLRNAIDETTSRPVDTTTSTSSYKKGLKIRTLTNGVNILGRISGNAVGFTTAYLEQTDGTLIKSVSLSGKVVGDWFDFNVSIDAGDYLVLIDKGGVSMTHGDTANNCSFPYSGSTGISIICGVDNYNTSGATSHDVVSVRATRTAKTSGNCLVKWTAQPVDVKIWDLSTYQRTLVGETLTIDVIKSTDNGANYSDAFTDIGQNFDISTIPANNWVGFRINLARANTANNPSCDYLARRCLR